MFQFVNRARHDRIGNGKFMGRLRHASTLCHGEKNVQVAQLYPTPDPVVPAHRLSLSNIASPMTKNSTFPLLETGKSYHRGVRQVAVSPPQNTGDGLPQGG